MILKCYEKTESETTIWMLLLLLLLYESIAQNKDTNILFEMNLRNDCRKCLWGLEMQFVYETI